MPYLACLAQAPTILAPCPCQGQNLFLFTSPNLRDPASCPCNTFKTIFLCYDYHNRHGVGKARKFKFRVFWNRQIEKKLTAIKEEALLSFTNLYLRVFLRPIPFLNLGAMTSLFITIVLFTLVDNMYVKEFYFPPKRNFKKVEGVHFRGPTM